MPIYEYVCRNCGCRFEWLTRDGNQPRCPCCGRNKLDKQLSLPVAHTAKTGAAACPVKQSGACSLPECTRGNCGMAEWA